MSRILCIGNIVCSGSGVTEVPQTAGIVGIGSIGKR